MAKDNLLAKKRRALRVRSKIDASASAPRLSVYRSNKTIYAQLIDDRSGHTLAFASSNETKSKGTKTEQALATGELLASRAGSLSLERVIFDRGPYPYHGRIAALAEGARKGGLKF